MIKARRALVRKIEAFADAVASAHNPNVESVDSDVAAEDFEHAIDAYAEAVRAEALAPATRGQSEESAKAEAWLRGQMEQRCDLVAAELDRLRARLAAAEAENAELRDLLGEAFNGLDSYWQDQNPAMSNAIEATARRQCGLKSKDGFTCVETHGHHGDHHDNRGGSWTNAVAPASGDAAPVTTEPVMTELEKCQRYSSFGNGCAGTDPDGAYLWRKAALWAVKVDQAAAVEAATEFLRNLLREQRERSQRLGDQWSGEKARLERRIAELESETVDDLVVRARMETVRLQKRIAELESQAILDGGRLGVMQAERDANAQAALEAKAKLQGLAEYCTFVERERDLLRSQLAMVNTDLDGVWRWQGDGYDHPESLSCPVVMSSETAREMAQAARELAELKAMGSPWPLRDVLSKLVEAADILLDDKSYDGHGYELIGSARAAARETLLHLDQPSAKPVCQNCRGRGEVTVDRIGDGPEGRQVPCPKCQPAAKPDHLSEGERVAPWLEQGDGKETT